MLWMPDWPRSNHGSNCPLLFQRFLAVFSYLSLSALCAVVVMFSLLRAVRGQGLAAASVDEIDAAAGHQKDCVVDMAAELSLGEQVQSNACGPCC